MKRNQAIQKVLWTTLGLNLLVSVLKIAIGFLGNITSVVADGFHSLADGFSNVIGLFGMKVASKPVDFDHAYGHQRYESLATLFIMTLLAFLGVEVVKRAIMHIIHPMPIQSDWVTIIIIIVTVIINIVVAIYQKQKSVQYKSNLLLADTKHTTSDVFISIGVLINLVLLTYFDAPDWIDSITSLIIAFIIFRAAYLIFIESSKELTDAIAIDPATIEAIVLEHDDVISVHKIRSRKSGYKIYVDFHVQCDPKMTLVKVHDVSHQLEDALKAHFGEQLSAIVHVEPKGYHYESDDGKSLKKQ